MLRHERRIDSLAHSICSVDERSVNRLNALTELMEDTLGPKLKLM